MADIARSLGVSVQTVSAVVNGKPGISEATQQRVRDTVIRLNFQPNQQARSLRGVRSKIVGVIIPSITNPYFPEFVKGIEEEARRTGYSIFLCNTDEKLEHLVDYLSLVETNRASGLICALGVAGDWLHHPEIEKRIHRFASENVSIVLSGQFDPDLPVSSLRVDAADAIRDAAQHLLQLGHTRIGVVAPPDGLAVTSERMQAFRSAFEELGQPLNEALVVPGGFDIDSGTHGAQQLMRRKHRPTAIIAANDLAAFGVIAGLSSLGLSVPKDVSVLGFDDIAFARVFQPALTTIAQPMLELGREALRLATRDPKSSDRAAELQARFVARSSTGPAD